MASRFLVQDDPEIVEGYLTDASNVRGHATALVRPRSPEEVAEVVAAAQRDGTPLTIVASQTSTTAASVPDGGWVVSLAALGGHGPIVDGTVEAGPAMILGELQVVLERSGWLLPPDPTSRFDCTVGGAVACNASGARSFRYGAIRDWVEALDVVLPDGRARHIERGDPIPADWPVPTWRGPAVKNAAGYRADSLLDLFIGQEGTLGVVTSVRFRLIPYRRWFGLVAWFGDRASAVACAGALRDAARAAPSGPLAPRAIEYLDAHCLQLARAHEVAVPADARAALFCEQEDVDGALSAWMTALTEHGALVDETLVTTDPAGKERLRAFRHAIPAGINERVAAHGMPKVGTDFAVPDAALSQMMDAYEAAPIAHVLFGHLGDNHLHLNQLPRTDAELSTARVYADELAALAVSLGGTVSAEHGIGKLKRAQFAHMVGPSALAELAALKRFLDPGWILGRGNVLAPEGVPSTGETRR